MNIEKISVKEHYVWVDKDALIKIGDVVYQVNFERTNHQLIKIENEHQANIANVKSGSFTKYKIIAADKELNLEGLPTYVEWLAEQEYPKSNKKGYPLYMPTTVDLIMSRAAFIKGYQAAEKELYTEDDIQYFFECGRNFQLNGEVTYKQALDEFKQLKK